jgi:hypothetical protein
MLGTSRCRDGTSLRDAGPRTPSSWLQPRRSLPSTSQRGRAPHHRPRALAAHRSGKRVNAHARQSPPLLAPRSTGRSVLSHRVHARSRPDVRPRKPPEVFLEAQGEWFAESRYRDRDARAHHGASPSTSRLAPSAHSRQRRFRGRARRSSEVQGEPTHAIAPPSSASRQPSGQWDVRVARGRNRLGYALLSTASACAGRTRAAQPARRPSRPGSPRTPTPSRSPGSGRSSRRGR